MDSTNTPLARPLDKSARSIRRTLARTIGFLLAAYLTVVVLMFSLQNSLIFFPAVYPDGSWNPRGLDFEDAWFEADDGTRLHGWYVAHEQPRAVILFAHGNAGNLSHRAGIVQALVQKLGVSVMIFDYRGYGRSAGSPTTKGILSDGRAARRWLAERAGIDQQQIVLMGESLGGAVMVDLAAKDGARALILEDTFSSLGDVGAHHYPWLPVRLLLGSDLDSVGKIGDYHGYLMMIHGEADTIVPLALARRLFDAANEPKSFIKIPGADHNDPPDEYYFQALDSLLWVLDQQRSQ
jgi:fermentation-respiration switch protein FrsA (DUF1100 family)